MIYHLLYGLGCWRSKGVYNPINKPVFIFHGSMEVLTVQFDRTILFCGRAHACREETSFPAAKMLHLVNL